MGKIETRRYESCSSEVIHSTVNYWNAFLSTNYQHNNLSQQRTGFKFVAEKVVLKCSLISTIFTLILTKRREREIGELFIRSG